MRELSINCNPQVEFLKLLFAKKERIDGRRWDEIREIRLNYNRKAGVSFASLGKTRVLCSIDYEISPPRKSHKPGAGSISFAIDVLPMAHPSLIALNKEVDECLNLLDALYRDTYCIDFDTLCIEMNQFVIDLRCQIRVMDYDAGIWDCVTLAVTTALIEFRRNDVTYDKITKKLIVHNEFERPQIPLTIYYKPTTVTFGFIEGMEKDPIIDPSKEESVLMSGYLVIGANHRDEICLIYQIGNLNVDLETIVKCSEFVLRRAKVIMEEMMKVGLSK